ncbi:MAG: long-chain fatty acid--CoA ligase, partial [Acidimicrobiia bacterium]|nr:long-chain fatty acid--CoA ligase [Acidimicrobiia bacterium]
FGVAHERLGEEVAAAIVARPGHEIDREELTAFLKERIAGYKVPTKVMTFTEALPRNPAGKILKRDLRDQFRADD